MQISTDPRHLPVFEALASEVRLKIIRLLADKQMNIKEIAGALGLSSAIVTMHVRKLEEGGIVRAERRHQDGVVQKLCTLATDQIQIAFPGVVTGAPDHVYEKYLPVGLFSDAEVLPTCGLATTEKLVGRLDDPTAFLDPDRACAGILWFSTGYVEYRLANPLLISDSCTEIEIIAEMCSEAPGFNPDWPSDIDISFNGRPVGTWTSPGDFNSPKGNFTPYWWNPHWAQFGLLKVISIRKDGTWIDGIKVSEICLEDIRTEERVHRVRLAVAPESTHAGGLTLFGRGFGNYGQDLTIRYHYLRKNRPAEDGN